ncbi:MAG: iron-sulfur cluster assembly protein [Candidatus Heimdallarchaeota archaeon]
MTPEISLSKENVEKAIKEVTHPEITMSLVDLGIATVKEVNNNKVLFEIAIPFPQVPELIINIFKRDLTAAVKKDFPVATMDFTLRIMTEEEQQRFLKSEQENWKGL